MTSEGIMMINCEQESHCYIRENGQRDAVTGKLEERIGVREEMKR